jgi:gelsolin
VLKPQKIDVSQTNLAFFGTELEKNVKRAAANGESAWSAPGVGTAVGVHVWRVEQFKVVARNETLKTHSFSLGDSYIVLSTTKKSATSDALVHAIHFWLGADTTQDEAGTAAYKTVELDDKLGGAATQFRECSHEESAEFLALFPQLNYVEGGVDTGFKHVVRDAHRARVLHVKGTAERVVVAEVPKAATSLNHGDVFLVDAGAKVLVFNGQESNTAERQAGAALARAIKDERGGKPEIVIDDEKELFALLGGSIDDVKAPSGDDAGVVSRKVLLRLNDGTTEPAAAAAPAAAASDALAPFNASLDADLFRTALHHMIGFDKKNVVALLSQRDRAQLQEIAAAYSKKHGRDLFADIKSKVGSLTHKDTQSLLEMLFAPARAVVDASALNQAIGVVSQVTMDDISTGTFATVRKSVLVDIIVSASLGEGLEALQAAFKKLTYGSLQVVIEKKSGGGLFGGGDFRDLALALLRGGRDASTTADAATTAAQAARLLKASEGRMIGTDVEAFIDVFARSSLAQIAATVEEVEKTSKKHAGDFAGLLASQRLSKSFRGALLYIVALARGAVEQHFAMRLYKAMKGLGTDAVALNYVLVTVRDSGKMERTKAAFYNMYGNTLSSWIKGDASGLWQKLMLSIIGEERPETYAALAGASGARKITFDVIARGDDVKRELLKSDDVFVLDDGHSVWAWCGDKSSSFEKKVALHYAQQYIAFAKLPPSTPITRIMEKGQHALFEAAFNI